MSSGVAPRLAHPIGETRLCGACARLIRYWPEAAVWRHVALGADHPPELAGSWAAGRSTLGAPVEPPLTETEARALWGDR